MFDKAINPDKINFKMKKGFTLIDAVMVIVLLGILVGLAIPRIEAFYEINLSSTSRRIAADIRYAQRLSISRYQNDTYGIEFSPSTDTYRLYKVSDGTNAKDPLTRNDYVMNFGNTTLYQGVDITSANFGGTNKLQFNFMGVPQDGNGNPSGGSVTISYQGYTKTISVNPATGRVYLQ